MKDFYSAVHAETLKLKRTLALRLAVIAPLLIVVMVFGVFLQRGTGPLVGFAQLTLTLWTIIVLPLYATLAAALLAGIEHQMDNWKHLLALPIDRRAIFAAKWPVGLGLLFLSSVILIIGVSLAAETLRLLKPGLHDAAGAVGLVVKRAMESMFATGLVFSIQMWISLRWRSFLPGLVVAVMALVMMFIAIPRGTPLFGSLFPWSLPAMAMAPISPHRALAIAWGALGGIALALIASRDLARREFS
jgi:lantibiotic transport system permease protein